MIDISNSAKNISILIKRISSIILRVGRWLRMVIDNVEVGVENLLERELMVIHVREKIGLVVP